MFTSLITFLYNYVSTRSYWVPSWQLLGKASWGLTLWLLGWKEGERKIIVYDWLNDKVLYSPQQSEDKYSPKILVLHYPTLSHFSAVNWSIWCWFLLRFVSILTFQAELCFETLRHDLASDTSAVYQNSHQNTWYHDCTRTATGTVYQIPLTPEQRLELVVSAEFRAACSNLWKPAWTVELLLLMSGLWRR